MRVNLDGRVLAYDDTGTDDPPVVLLHGFPFNRRIWDRQAEAISPRFRVIRPDLRGHGDSPPGPGPSRMEDLAGEVVRLLDHLGVGPAVIGGLSMGGYVALAFYRLFPARARALVLADTRAGADTPEGRNARHEMVALVREEGAHAVADKLLPKMLSPRASAALKDALRTLMASTSVEGVAGALLGMAERADSTDLLPRIECPTLIVVGAEDAITPPAESEAMAKRISRSRLVVIESAGHVSSLEQPEAFNRALEEFLLAEVGPR